MVIAGPANQASVSGSEVDQPVRARTAVHPVLTLAAHQIASWTATEPVDATQPPVGIDDPVAAKASIDVVCVVPAVRDVVASLALENVLVVPSDHVVPPVAGPHLVVARTG